MYVLKELLGMSEEYLLCDPSEKDGKFLMEEILMSRYFGLNDLRMGQLSKGGYLKRRVSFALRRFEWNMRFFTRYLGEVIWGPFEGGETEERKVCLASRVGTTFGRDKKE